MKRPADLVIHLPVPHTGGDAVAQRLTGRRGQLRDDGVAFVRGLASDRPASPAAYAGRLRERSMFELRRTATRQEGKQIVLVHDDALLGPVAASDGSGGWYPHARRLIEPLVAALMPARTTLLLTIRRQDRWLERHYVDAVLSGSSDELDTWMSTLPSPAPDYEELAHRLVAVPGVDRFEVIPVEAAGDDPTRMAGLVLDATGTGLDAEAEHLSESAPDPVCSRRGLAVARALNPELETDRERQLVRRFVLDTFPAAFGDLVLLAPSMRRDLLASRADANHRLLARYQPAVDPAAYADDKAITPLAVLRPPGVRAPARVGLTAQALRRWDRVPSRWRQAIRVPARGRLRR